GAALLLALVEHADPERQLADRRSVGLDGLKAREEIALVVRKAAGEEKAVALGRLKWGRRPLVERIRRLDVVVVVNKQRAIAAAGFADDRRRSTIDGESFRGDAASGLRTVKHDPRGLRDANALRRHGRLPDQDLELVDVLALATAHVRIEAREVGHARKVSFRSGRSSFGSCSCQARIGASTA